VPTRCCYTVPPHTVLFVPDLVAFRYRSVRFGYRAGCCRTTFLVVFAFTRCPPLNVLHTHTCDCYDAPTVCHTALSIPDRFALVYLTLIVVSARCSACYVHAFTVCRLRCGYPFVCQHYRCVTVFASTVTRGLPAFERYDCVTVVAFTYVLLLPFVYRYLTLLLRAAFAAFTVGFVAVAVTCVVWPTPFLRYRYVACHRCSDTVISGYARVTIRCALLSLYGAACLPRTYYRRLIPAFTFYVATRCYCGSGFCHYRGSAFCLCPTFTV